MWEELEYLGRQAASGTISRRAFLGRVLRRWVSRQP